ncbi:hypothetical protein B9J07_27755 [Sinorhizobium sp. LM21]|uniref:hypothetical protein n=1 Tax=Sinorhizobium sp. LM21 TaxID=1449788 RepID=UPI000B5B5F59|nr:hypothetical protein [Sinorhizobium sp. LM21]OWZ90385.1 hypothetical protein B9J07_27755 [Sinorhizobium sp. LM21]
MTDNSLHYCANDRERLVLCEFAQVAHKAVTEHVIEHAMRLPAKKVTYSFNVVTIDTFEHGQIEIIVRKKL